MEPNFDAQCNEKQQLIEMWVSRLIKTTFKIIHIVFPTIYINTSEHSVLAVASSVAALQHASATPDDRTSSISLASGVSRGKPFDVKPLR